MVVSIFAGVEVVVVSIFAGVDVVVVSIFALLPHSLHLHERKQVQLSSLVHCTRWHIPLYIPLAITAEVFKSRA